MAQRIPCYQPREGNEVADRALADIAKMFGGYIPNFHKVLANSPAVVTAFEAMRRTLQGTKIRAIEREIIALEVSRRSNCEYCIAAHSKFARAFKMPASDLEALLSGRPMADPRSTLVQRATQRLIDTEGHLSDPELAEFRAAGLNNGELIEVIAVIGWYVLSTYVNNLADTEIDAFWTT